MRNLKPCPFCGKSPMIATANNGLTTIACSSCECEFGWFENESKATEAWNTRAEIQTQHTHCCPCGAERTCERGEEFWECSSCGLHGLRNGWNYCPSCGAKVVE